MKPNKAGSHCNKAINSPQPMHSKKKLQKENNLNKEGNIHVFSLASLN